MDVRELLLAPLAFMPPEKVLEDLSAAEAERRVPETPHSIAEIVAHISFWQDWFYARCMGQAVPMAATAAEGWPKVGGDSWPTLRTQFLSRLNQLAELGSGDTSRLIAPPIEFPPLAHYTISDTLIHVATHNSHHLGQVVTLRQLLGAWPPPAGSWTW